MNIYIRMYIFHWKTSVLTSWRRGRGLGSLRCSCLCETYVFTWVLVSHCFLSVPTCVAGCVCPHTCACMRVPVRNLHLALLLAEAGHREPQQSHSCGARGWRNCCGAGAVFCWTPDCPSWISWHPTRKMTNQFILLRISIASLTAGQMGRILEEYITTAFSRRLLGGRSLWSLTTRSEFKLRENR